VCGETDGWALDEKKRNLLASTVHSTSRGHEAIQIAAGFQLKPYWFCFSLLSRWIHAVGYWTWTVWVDATTKWQSGTIHFPVVAVIMDIPHWEEGFPIIPHQSSATGMQAIPATGDGTRHFLYGVSRAIEIIRQASGTLFHLWDGLQLPKGEVAEAFSKWQCLKNFQSVYLVQDNGWGIRQLGWNAYDGCYEYASGFKGLERMQVDCSDFIDSFHGLTRAFQYSRFRPITDTCSRQLVHC